MNSLSIIDPVKKATSLSNISRLPHPNITMMPQSNEKEKEQSLPSATNELPNVSHGPCCWLLCIDRNFLVWSSFRCGGIDITTQTPKKVKKIKRSKAKKPKSKNIVLTGASQASHEAPVSVFYHIRTVWLTTRNDLKSIVIPETAFGIFSALSGPVLTTNPSPDSHTILERLPLVILWTWINVLIFDLANQRLSSSVLEDSINKPWRPLPSGRLTVSHARRLLLAVVPLGFVLTLYLGGMEETVAMMALTWMYNDLGGADESFVVRNLINAFGFMCYSSGATIVAGGYGQFTLNAVAYQWLAMVGGIVFTTLQMQDMADQEGDQARGRGTIPLVLGDGPARWTIVIPVLVWSVACPWFWELHPYAFIVPVTLGLLLSLRLLLLRSVDADKTTWKVWNVWISSVYLLPLIKYHFS